MCGIAGILRFDNQRPDVALLARMVQTLAHRGPDASGVWADGPVALGHSRLSIIDPQGGRQPMLFPQRDLAISFNGEIYNYRELRESLLRRGDRFQTRSDTEVLLHCFAEFGRPCLSRLNGQWAFAIWDGRQRELFLARDRFGIRPLYWTMTNGSFRFASEVKALLVDPAVRRELCPEALAQVLTFWAPVAPRTVFRDIFELPPGHAMTVRDGRACIWQYWQPDFPQPRSRTATSDDWADECLERLVEAVRLRLRSDVPVGAYLSGGLDSSLTAALVQRYTDAPLETFSVGFEQSDYDEAPWQQQVAAHLRTAHHQIRCRAEDIGRVFPRVVEHAERPILRTAPAPLFLLSELVRQTGFKVVVTGEGADEVFGGYDLFKEAKVRRFRARLPNSLLRPLLLKRLYPYLGDLHTQSPSWLDAFFRADDLDDPFFAHRPRWRMTSGLRRLLSDDWTHALDGYDPVEELADRLPSHFSSWHPLRQAQFLETTVLLPGYILSSQGDRMAMAHSVEGRFPFLDHRLAEFAARCPARILLCGLNEKHLLKQVARRFLPEAVCRRPKQPYRAPDGESFFDAEQGTARFDYVDELLSEDRLREAGVWDSRRVAHLTAKFRRGRVRGTRDNMALVAVLSTQLLVDRFLRPDSTAATSLPEMVTAVS